jgi:hypothetical protein
MADRAYKEITLTVDAEVEPLAQLISVLFDLLNQEFDDIPLDAQSHALKYVSEVRGR